MRQTGPLFSSAPTARFKAKGLDHGQHIYAYRHVYTNQVLYSLTQSLDGIRSLRQLPDVGANTPQATGRIRRDLWRPLFSVSFPSPTHGSAQGYDAFHKLREWRKLHELYWTPPASLSQPYTEEQKEALQERLDTRGGNKKETVYDLIKREKKKVRRAEAMDQKANSIADLAAVLIEQDDQGIWKEQVKTSQQNIARFEELRDMLILSHHAADKNGLLSIERRMQALQPYVERREGFRIEEGARMSQRLARRRLYQLEKRKARMIFAQQAVADAVRAHMVKKRCESTENRLREELAGLEEQLKDALASSTNWKGGSDEKRRARPTTWFKSKMGYARSVSKGLAEVKAKVLENGSFATLSERTQRQIDSTNEQIRRLEEASKALAPALTGEETRELEKTREGYLAALDRDLLLSKLEAGPELITSETPSPNLRRIQYEISQLLEKVRTSGQSGTSATSSQDATDEDVGRWERNLQVCDRLLPHWAQARGEVQRHRSEVVRQWIEDIEMKLKPEESRASNADSKETLITVLHGYKKMLEIVEEIVNEPTEATPNFGLWTRVLDAKIQAEEAFQERSKSLRESDARADSDAGVDVEEEVEPSERAAISPAGVESESNVQTIGESSEQSQTEYDTSEASDSAESTQSMQSLKDREFEEVGEINYFRHLPSFPPDESQPDEGLFPKRVMVSMERRAREAKSPVFTMEGVTVRWNDILDSEFADAWPQEVVHERMGTVKFTAPKAVAAEGRLLTAEELKEQKAQQLAKMYRGRDRFVLGVTDAVVEAVAAGRGSAEERRARDKGSAASYELRVRRRSLGSDGLARTQSRRASQKQ